MKYEMEIPASAGIGGIGFGICGRKEMTNKKADTSKLQDAQCCGHCLFHRPEPWETFGICKKHPDWQNVDETSTCEDFDCFTFEKFSAMCDGEEK